MTTIPSIVPKCTEALQQGGMEFLRLWIHIRTLSIVQVFPLISLNMAPQSKYFYCSCVVFLDSPSLVKDMGASTCSFGSFKMQHFPVLTLAMPLPKLSVKAKWFVSQKNQAGSCALRCHVEYPVINGEIW